MKGLLPGWGSGECAVSISQHGRKLRSLQHSWANLLDEVDVRQDGATWIRMRIEYANFLGKFLANDLDRLQKI